MIFNRKDAKAQRFIAHCCTLLLLTCTSTLSFAQQKYELNSGWLCAGITHMHDDVNTNTLSLPSYQLKGWMPATVPGTVLTTLINNKNFPDPFYGMNNKLIPDIYTAGRPEYTYWFVNDFMEHAPLPGEHVYLELRGVNYNFNAFINGSNGIESGKSMFLRQSLDITSFMAKDGHNRLAIIVRPPEPAGNPNGGQGGDGAIAHSVTNQFVAGWDWIQPVHDRNTGIWDKVFIKRTKQVNIDNTHIVTHVPGKRTPDGKQATTSIRVSTEVENSDTTEIEGTLQCEIEGKKYSVKVTLAPHSMEVVELPVIYVDSPRLWWPNGYGPQNLYDAKVKFLINGKTLSDEEDVTFGIRELKAVWNTKTKSRELRVNGQKIFIKGGNWILSDELLRFSKERYDAEIRFHRDMNLNLIRVWGGGITERPEFYDACDKYGLLVMQDFWVSGDCNGRWDDPMKLDDSDTRKKYPDDHGLFVESLEDQIKMLRNHPSLALWCGGNEIRPPADVLGPLRDSLLPTLDGTRFFFEYSNDDSMSYQSGDGPYTIQKTDSFWKHRSFPFNSEVGSVGIGDVESLERFIPKEDLVPPFYDNKTNKWVVDSVWSYHKYIGYDSAIEVYGHPSSISDFAMKAQLVNYDQYRALIEGFSSHMWDWYTGMIIWKTQNPWTAMLGQMYDVYLDPNACMYGLSEGSKPVHIMYDPVRKMVMIANNTFKATGNMKVSARVFDMKGNERLKMETLFSAPQSKATNCKKFGIPDSLTRSSGAFLYLSLSDSMGALIDEHIYWVPDGRGNYSGLGKMPKANVNITVHAMQPGVAEVTINVPANGTLAFFNRISVVDAKTKKRILPVFYNNNYISVLPGQQRTVRVEFTPQKNVVQIISVEGWNVDKKFIELK